MQKDPVAASLLLASPVRTRSFYIYIQSPRGKDKALLVPCAPQNVFIFPNLGLNTVHGVNKCLFCKFIRSRNHTHTYFWWTKHLTINRLSFYLLCSTLLFPWFGTPLPSTTKTCLSNLQNPGIYSNSTSRTAPEEQHLQLILTNRHSFEPALSYLQKALQTMDSKETSNSPKTLPTSPSPFS